MIEFLMCFKLGNFHRYSLGYIIGGSVMCLEFYGYSFWRVFWLVSLCILVLMDAINLFLSELDIDNDKYFLEKDQILTEKMEQKRRREQ